MADEPEIEETQMELQTVSKVFPDLTRAQSGHPRQAVP